jgi:ribose/xylose/arabinose/galactoside ABC-type transport system permease subunit
MDMKALNFTTIKWREYIIYIASVCIFIFFSIVSPEFFSSGNLMAIFRSMVLVCILGIGITFVLTSGEIDLSIGALLAVSPCVFAVLLNNGLPLALSFFVALCVVLSFGILNGFVTERIGVPSFITTLGSMGIAMGLTRIVTGNSPVAVESNVILNVFSGDCCGFPKIIIWMVAILIISYFLLHTVKFGRNVQCIGDNRDAAFLYGINIKRTVIAAFVLNSFFVFLAGMLELGRSSHASPGSGEPLLLTAIAASVIGGTSLRGGKGSIIGTFVGAFFLTVIANGLFSLGFPPWTNDIIIGFVIISTLVLSGFLERADKRNIMKYKR